MPTLHINNYDFFYKFILNVPDSLFLTNVVRLRLLFKFLYIITVL